MTKTDMKEIEGAFKFIRNGKSIKQYGQEGYPITRIETISNGQIDMSRLGYADIHDTILYEDYLLKKNDILMSHINSESHLAKTAIYNFNDTIIHGMNLLCLRPKPEVLIGKYAFYYFNSKTFKRQIPKIIKKSVNQASFTVTALKKLKIPLPPLTTQKKIVALLDGAQSLIDKRKAQIALLDELIKSTFYTMFGDPVTNPMGWEKKSLSILTSKIGSGATPRGGRESYKNKGISLIRSMNIYNNVFEYKDLAFIDNEQAGKLDNVTVEENDVLFNITGASVARACIVPNCVLPARVNQHVSILRAKTNQLLSSYLVHLLTNDMYQQYLLKLGGAGGATREAITKEQLLDLIIPLPPLTLQNQFAEKVQAIEAQKTKMQAGQKAMEELFGSLMQRSFSGEIE